MTTTEDRLRDAFQADAGTIQPGTLRAAPSAPEAARRASGPHAARPAEEAPQTPGGPRRERRPLRPGLFRPGRVRGSRLGGGPAGWVRSRPAVAALAAASAVLAIAVAATVAGNSGSPRPGALSALGTPPPPAPRYLIGLARAGLSVYNAQTGRRVSVIKEPGHGATFIATAATAPGRFVVATGSAQGCTSRLYRLTLTRRGRLDRLDPLPGGRIGGMLTSPSLALAASAGGRVIAYAASHCNAKPGWLEVLHPATGQTRRWPLKSEGVMSMDMTPDGQRLYFDYSAAFGGDGTIRVLRTSAPAGPMTERASIVLPASSGVDSAGGIALAGHGRVLLACTEVQHSALLTAYSAATGGELGVLHTWHHVDVAPCTPTTASSGGYVLITDLGTHPWRVQLSSGHARQLPIGSDEDPVRSVGW